MKKLEKISHRQLLFVLLFIIFGVIIPIYWINRSLHVDESTFLVIGNCIKNGSVLYRDVANVKPPGVFYLAALVFSTIGKSFIAMRVITYIVHAISALLIFAIGRKIANKNVGMIASILFLIGVYIPQHLGSLYLTEPYVVFFTILSIFFFLKEDSYSKFLAGIALGMGIIFKQTAIFLFGVFFLFYLTRLRFKNNRTKQYVTNSAKNIIICILGAAIPLAIVFLYFFVNGAVDGMLYYTISSISGFNQSPTAFFNGLVNYLSYFPVWLLSISMILVVAYKFLIGKTENDNHLLLTIWLLVFSIPAVIGGSHRILFIIPAASLLAGLLLYHLYQHLIRKDNHIQLKSFVITTLLIFTAISAAICVYGSASVISYNVNDQIKAAHDIEPYIDDGKMYTFPFQNYLFLFSNLTPRTKIVGDVYSTESVEEVIKDLKTYNVTYIVAVRDVVEMLDKGEQPSYYPQPKLLLYDFIKENYHLVENVSYYTIFKLNHHN